MVMPTSLANKRMEVANFIFRQGIGGGELNRILLKIYIKRSEGGGERGSRGMERVCSGTERVKCEMTLGRRTVYTIHQGARRGEGD